MKGFVPTPDGVVDRMVAKLFQGRRPSASTRILDPGCGTGAFIAGIIRWCKCNRADVPGIVGIEQDLRHIPEARAKFAAYPSVEIRHADFLAASNESFDFVIGNPPYVPITALTGRERSRYRGRFASASGRFDLYMLFFEQSLGQLRPGGRLVFITPEKFAYVGTASRLRMIFGRHHVEEIELASEATFGDLVTYPAITTVSKIPGPGLTRVAMRDGQIRFVGLQEDGSSWMAALNGHSPPVGGPTLEDVCERVSCGVATGADSVFVMKDDQVPDGLRKFAHPTVSGRQISGGGVAIDSVMLVPYTLSGELLEAGKLGSLAGFLGRAPLRRKLMARTCVARKPWYAFHETPQLGAMLKPKILCKDIAADPFFVADEGGGIIPRHSVYYIIPKDPSKLKVLAEYLNSEAARAWLRAHCQHAANGFLRLQSHVLKRLPVPAHLAPEPEIEPSWSRPIEVVA